MRNSQRTTERRHALKVIVGRLGRVLAGQRKGTGVQIRVAERDTDTGVIQGPAAPPIVAECLRLRKRRSGGVVHAPIDGEDIRGALAEVARERPRFVWWLRRIARWR